MSRSLAISDLLNPVEPISTSRGHLPSIPISSLLNPASSENSATREPIPQQQTEPRSLNDLLERTLIHTDYNMSRKTKLLCVYQYPVNAVLEYPETGPTVQGTVGHLFQMDPTAWLSPGLDFAYSRGAPRGNSKEWVTNPLLVDSHTGEMVPCISRHSTCQGVKVCPFYELDEDQSSHYSATRDQLRTRMHHSKEQQTELTSPSRDVFERTSAYFTAIQRVGCYAEADQPLECSSSSDDGWLALRRGYPEMRNRCTGRLVFEVNFDGDPYIKCEHHSRQTNRDHFFDNTIGNGRFNLDYLEALLTNDHEEIVRIESDAQADGYGPRTSCHTVMNNTAQRPTCPWNHRNAEDHILKQPNLVSLDCRCTFREYEPLEQYRASCPFFLITSKGPHSHPIPLPEKTPRSVKLELANLFKKLEVDLADMTPRKFLRHPILRAYLSTKYTMLRNPMLSDLHISLSNRSHLKVYIEHAKRLHFPEGTGWKGLLHIKSQQDALLPPADQYIRFMAEIPADSLDPDEFDDKDDVVSEDQPEPFGSQPLRIVICMTSAASIRFVEAQHLQSDIGFKRIVGFYEFEIASIDGYSNTSITYCRVYLTRQTAQAHLIVLREINRILVRDTGRGLRWRHVHGTQVDDYDSVILNWVVDQHRGQAKGKWFLFDHYYIFSLALIMHVPGIGLYVQEITQQLPHKADFHQPLRWIQDLGPYDHLRRFLTLCTTHLQRNIKKQKVSEEVKNEMRGLICMRHDDWEGSLEKIKTSGGLAGKNWVADKETSKFAFPGMCWEKSYIPLDIWQARRRESNVVEIVHANVNLEGKFCTLVGGMYKGRHYDTLKQRVLTNREDYGIRESYSSMHPYENAMKNTKRKLRGRKKNLTQEDARIEAHNHKITKLLEKANRARERTQRCLELAYPETSASTFTPTDTALNAHQKALETHEKARLAFLQQAEIGEGLVGSGSGRVHIMLPPR